MNECLQVKEGWGRSTVILAGETGTGRAYCPQEFSEG